MFKYELYFYITVSSNVSLEYFRQGDCTDVLYLHYLTVEENTCIASTLSSRDNRKLGCEQFVFLSAAQLSIKCPEWSGLGCTNWKLFNCEYAILLHSIMAFRDLNIQMLIIVIRLEFG